MILRNKKGTERNFRILFEYEKNNKKYIIYEDINTLNIYGGIKEENYLKPLEEQDYIFINSILEKING